MSSTTRRERKRRSAGSPQGGALPGRRVPGRTATLMDLSDEEQSAALKIVIEWLDAWKRHSWGNMATLSQLPKGVVTREPEMCRELEKNLGPNPLDFFMVGDIPRGHSEEVHGKRVGFADFRVVAQVRGTRIGIIPRVVFDGGHWGVNYTSINRRFNPEAEE